MLERSIKQLQRRNHRVLLAAVPGTLPEGAAPLPAGTELHPMADPSALERLRAEHAGALVVAADVVRPGGGQLDGGTRVYDETTRRAAEDAIFATLLRGDLGVVARHLNKPISFRITRYLLCKLPITPNQVTLAAGLVGLVGAALIALGRAWSVIGGLLLAHLQSVLDGCDGELARVRFQQSAIGEWLDTLVDDGLNLALVTALGVGLARLSGRNVYLYAGLLGAAMLLFYNVVAYRELLRQGEGGEVLKIRWWFGGGRDLKALHATTGHSALGHLAALGRRDFFVLSWLLLAAAGLHPVIMIWAVTMAGMNFLVAAGQVLWRLRGRG